MIESGRAGAMVSWSPPGQAIRVPCPVPATRNDSEDHWTQATKERRWWLISLETHGQSHPKSEPKGTSGLTKWTSVQQKLLKKDVIYTRNSWVSSPHFVCFFFLCLVNYKTFKTTYLTMVSKFLPNSIDESWWEKNIGSDGEHGTLIMCPSENKNKNCLIFWEHLSKYGSVWFHVPKFNFLI